jgi:methylenetetrahydrofolate dehydrogenase (NADP+)/methenyltetrahydrofolate cyclohydrolase
LKEKGINPTLGVIFAGSNSASKSYTLSKAKLGEKLGIKLDIVFFPDDVPSQTLISQIELFNNSPSVQGILIELPLPSSVNVAEVLSTLDPLKDVDGAHPLNRGRLLRGELEDTLLPVTPLSCLALLASVGISPAGKKITVVGRGETVGLPLAVLCLKKDATVTICHTRTPNLCEAVQNADILLTAAGSPGLITPQMLHPSQAVIDCGIYFLPDGTLSGDVSPEASKIVSYLSPVPGGVGSLTSVFIFTNLLKAIRLQEKAGRF